MTTITIERDKVERWLSALENVRLLAARHRHEEWAQHMLRFCDDGAVTAKTLRAAPATAPEPICTKCGDVITAHDPGLCGCCLSTRDATSPEQKDRPINCGTGHCSYIECAMPGGPLLKDKP